jgi:hypothetical protein
MSYGRAGSVLQWEPKTGESLDELPVDPSGLIVGVEDGAIFRRAASGPSRSHGGNGGESRPLSDELPAGWSTPTVAVEDAQSSDELRTACGSVGLARGVWCRRPSSGTMVS